MATPSEIMNRPAATIAETATVLPISRPAIYALVRDGRLETIRVGRRILVKTSSIRKLLGD